MDLNTENLILMGMTGMMSDPVVKNIIATELIQSNDETKQLAGISMLSNTKPVITSTPIIGGIL